MLASWNLSTPETCECPIGDNRGDRVDAYVDLSNEMVGDWNFLGLFLRCLNDAEQLAATRYGVTNGDMLKLRPTSSHRTRECSDFVG